jgi:hypothetical protein
VLQKDNDLSIDNESVKISASLDDHFAGAVQRGGDRPVIKPYSRSDRFYHPPQKFSRPTDRVA